MNKINYVRIFVIAVVFFFAVTSDFLNKTNKNEQIAFAATVSGGETVSVIRPSCSGYEVNTCFTSLASWESNFGGIDFGTCTRGDLVCINTSAVAKIEGNWTSADNAVTISGWTTSSTNYIKIYTSSDARHSGVWSDSKYRISSTLSSIDVREKNVIIDGLQMALTGSLGWKNGVRYEPEESLVPGGTHTVSNCIIKSTNTSTSGINGINASNWDAESSVSFYNNIVYGFSGYGIYLKLLSSSNAFIYNNTVYGVNGNGIEVSNNSALLKNNIVQSSLKNYVGTAKTGSSNNISFDGTALGSNSKINQTVSFISTNAGSEDFHLSSSDTSARDSGISLSGDSGVSFSIDIDGSTRSGAWDIGADEQSGSTPPTPPPSDTTPPTVSSPSPSGTLSSGTTSVTLSVTTNETSVCKYSVTANTSYTSMTNTMSANSNTHTAVVNNLTNGTTYNYYVKCRDTAGNTTASNTAISFNIGTSSSLPDTQAPTGGIILINSDSGTTNSLDVVLTLSASDNVGVTQMKFSDNDLTYSEWENYSTTKNWILSSGDGTKTIYVKYRDLAGNVSSSVSDSIIYATPTTPPASGGGGSGGGGGSSGGSGSSGGGGGSSGGGSGGGGSVSYPGQTNPTNVPAPANIITIFTQNLSFGSENDMVKKLQEFLAKDKTIYPEGIISGFYGNMTVKAIQRFQSKYNIVTSGTPETTGYGSVGPKTRLKLNEVYGGDSITSAVSNTSNLTTEQANSIINLLISFGADTTVVNKVRSILIR